jgi:hypothetical protein
MRAPLIPLLPVLLLSTVALVSNPTWAAAPASAKSTQTSDAAATHVLGFAANDHYEHAEALTKALKQVISSSTNAQLGEGDFSLEVLTAALGCNDVPDTSCLKKIAHKTQVHRFIWGTLSIDGQKVNVVLHLYDEGGTSKKTQFSYQSSLTDSMDADLVGLASTAVSELLEPLTYKVLVRTRQKEGKVLVDNHVVGTVSGGEATIETTSGKHVFRLEVDDREPVEQNVRVRIDGTTKVRLDPTKPLAESRTAAVAPTPKRGQQQRPVTEPPVEEDRGGGNAQRTWGYITLGAGGVLLAAGGFTAGRLYLLSEDSDFKAYRAGLSTNEDACTEADRNRVVLGAATPASVRSTCSEGKTLEVVEIVLLASGVVAAGTGLTLLLTSKPSAKAATTRFEPRMSVGQGHANLGLLMRF